MPKQSSAVPVDSATYLDLAGLSPQLACEVGVHLALGTQEVRATGEEAARARAEAAEPDHVRVDLSDLTLRQAFELGRKVDAVLAAIRAEEGK